MALSSVRGNSKPSALLPGWWYSPTPQQIITMKLDTLHYNTKGLLGKSSALQNLHRLSVARFAENSMGNIVIFALLWYDVGDG